MVSIVVVMPAYDAGRQIRGVIDRVAAQRELGIERILVIDDGSHDDTASQVRAAAAEYPFVELHARAANGGYGAAMKDGLAAARASDPEIVACVHADGQYSPEALPGLVRELRVRQLDLLQGSRIAGGAALAGGMPLYKYLGNAVLNQLENRSLQLSMTDYHSGYLIYGRRSLREIPFHALSDRFHFDLEVIASARARRFRVGEAPIPTHYGDEVSHLNPLRYGLSVLRVLWNYGRGRYDPA